MSTEQNPYAEEDLSFIESKELETFLSFIHENTETLRSRIDVLENSKLHLLVFLTSIFTVFSAGVLVFTWEGRKVFFEREISTLLPVSIITSIAISITYVLYFSRLRRNERDIRRLAGILKVLVRRGSQLRDRGTLGFAQKIYVDVRLSDAESVLEQAYTVSRSLIARLARSMVR